jgi:hypothetical protein
MAVSSSNDVGCNEYLPGGIASCVVGKWTGRIVETITDKSGLGRWAGHLLTSRNNTHTVVITAYRPVKAPGFLTTYQQQWRMLRLQNNPDPDPRQQLLEDLERQITQWRAKSYEIILMWDANEGIQSHKSKIHKFILKTGLNPIHAVYPTASYSRGSTCIDFIHATDGIRNAVTNSGYLAFFVGIWTSDHRGLFADINFTTLLTKQPPDIATHIQRHLSSNNRTQVFKFIAAVSASNHLPLILQSLEELEDTRIWTTQNSELLESLAKFRRVESIITY